uniref:Odorant-binding protein 1 n=1 Tax=Sitobion avenae TaxID=44664 RepID=A0A1I9ZLA8_9HEMI|nr:odorant-binding protein 1 [Sitobion avenae]
MLNLKVMMFLCLSVTVVYCEIEENRLNNNTAIEICILETNIPKDEFQAMVTMPNNPDVDILTTRAQKCMLGCVMRKNHIINDGYVSTDVLYRYVMNFYGAVPNTKRKLLSRTVSKVIDICTKKDNLPTEECVLADLIMTCVRSEALKRGLQR